MSSKAKKSKPGKKPRSVTAAQLTSTVAAKAGLTKAQVKDVFAGLQAAIASELKAGHPVAVPGLVKIKIVRKPATAARQGINPFTKEPMTIKAKPARNAVKVLALKQLKSMA